MKKVLCYVAIFLLIILIITPPLLRVFYPEKEVIEEPADIYSMLECRKDSYYIASSYKNYNSLNIKFERLENDPNLEVLSDEYELEFILDSALKGLVSANIQEANDEKRINYFVEYQSIVDDKLLPLSDYRLSLEEQKIKYEDKGYVCDIVNF